MRRLFATSLAMMACMLVAAAPPLAVAAHNPGSFVLAAIPPDVGSMHELSALALAPIEALAGTDMQVVASFDLGRQRITSIADLTATEGINVSPLPRYLC